MRFNQKEDHIYEEDNKHYTVYLSDHIVLGNAMCFTDDWCDCFTEERHIDVSADMSFVTAILPKKKLLQQSFMKSEPAV